MTIETITIRQTIEHGPFTFEVRCAFVEDGAAVSAEIITPDCDADGWDPQTLSSDDAYPTAAILAAITAATGRRVEVIDGQMDGRSETWRLTDLGPADAGAATTATTLDTLIAAGHATRTPGATMRPVMDRGWYPTVDGWNTLAFVSDAGAQQGHGYSDAYLAAWREVTAELGPVDPTYDDGAHDRAILARLGLTA